VSKKSRTKGHGFERKTANTLKDIWPTAERGLQYRDGINCADVEGTPFYVECKRYASALPHSVDNLIDEAVNKQDRPVILIHKLDRRPAVVSMRLDDFIKHNGGK